MAGERDVCMIDRLKFMYLPIESDFYLFHGNPYNLFSM